MKDPLSRVVRIGLGQTVRVFFLGELGPVVEIEGDFDQCGVGDI